MDRGDWGATDHRVAKSWIRLKRLSAAHAVSIVQAKCMQLMRWKADLRACPGARKHKEAGGCVPGEEGKSTGEVAEGSGNPGGICLQ